MKNFLLLTIAFALVLPAASYGEEAPKVGTVDMDRAFKEYNKTKDSEKKINEAQEAAKKEYDDRAAGYKKALDEINTLNKQVDSPALSADKKTSMAKERDAKIANIKTMEREISEFRDTRGRQLQEQVARMRENIVKEITDVIMERVKSSGFDLVFDKSGLSTSGVQAVLYSKDSMDFTTDVVTALNKKPVTTSTTAPAISPKKP